MPPMEMTEFKLPDDQDDVKIDIEDDKFEIEIEDDTPDEDKGKQPMPKEIVEEIEKDELEAYSDDVKTKLKQLKKVYHDERRAKEEAYREQQEALAATKRLLEENRKMKQILQNGEKDYVDAVKNSANLQLRLAKQAYKDAYDTGDADKMLEAQQVITQSTMQLERANNFKLPPLQEENFEVQTRQEQAQPVRRPDDKAMSWQERNSWFGSNRSMTAYALGLHEELRDNGVEVGSDQYYSKLDKTMRKRFPEFFQDTLEEEETPKKAPTVVAAATRSTGSKKVKLKVSQVAIAKKLGLTPEQYVQELLKLEK